jgi:hypothetical protein
MTELLSSLAPTTVVAMPFSEQGTRCFGRAGRALITRDDVMISLYHARYATASPDGQDRTTAS